VPVALSPLIVTLTWAQRKAKKLGLVDDDDDENILISKDHRYSTTTKIKHFAEDLDLVGVSWDWSYPRREGYSKVMTIPLDSSCCLQVAGHVFSFPSPLPLGRLTDSVQVSAMSVGHGTGCKDLTWLNLRLSLWSSGSMVAMLVIGPILLIIFGYWELNWAKEPVVAWRFLKNRNVVAAALIGL
jgi:hypothetical protein